MLDLRGTKCTWDREKVPSSFFPANEKHLYHPTTPLEALSLLTSSPDLLPSNNTALLHIDHLTHPTPKHHRDCGVSLDHRDSVALKDVGSQCNVNTFYLQTPSNTAPLNAHSRRQMPQWGQELLMLYREPPPWSKMQTPPNAPVPPKTRSLQELAAVRRTDEQAMKSLQKMQDMLSERHRISRTESNISCDGLKESAKLSAPRNPFAKPHSGGSSEHVSERPNEKTRASSPQIHAVAKSIMEAPPKSLRPLKPITSLPVPRPSNTPALANKGREFQPVLPRPRSSYESSQERVSVSLQINDSEGQKAEMVVASAAISRSRRGPSERADLAKDPSMGRKRSRTAAPTAAGSKK